MRRGAPAGNALARLRRPRCCARMNDTERLLRDLGSDAVELSPELFAAAAKDDGVIAKLREILLREADRPGSLSRREVNLASWAAYVFAENGSPSLLAPILAIGGLPEDAVRRVLGAYADRDLPVILLRLAGDTVADTTTPLLQTYRGAPEVRVAPILAAGAAWAHGLLSRDAALKPLREELERMANDSYADAQDDEWLDTVLDAALFLNPAGVEDDIEALREYWGLEDDLDAELAAAEDEQEEDVKSRLRDMFPLFTRAMQFVERWDAIDAEEDDA